MVEVHHGSTWLNCVFDDIDLHKVTHLYFDSNERFFSQTKFRKIIAL